MQYKRMLFSLIMIVAAHASATKVSAQTLVAAPPGNDRSPGSDEADLARQRGSSPDAPKVSADNGPKNDPSGFQFKVEEIDSLIQDSQAPRSADMPQDVEELQQRLARVEKAYAELSQAIDRAPREDNHPVAPGWVFPRARKLLDTRDKLQNALQQAMGEQAGALNGGGAVGHGPGRHIPSRAIGSALTLPDQSSDRRSRRGGPRFVESPLSKLPPEGLGKYMETAYADSRVDGPDSALAKELSPLEVKEMEGTLDAAGKAKLAALRERLKTKRMHAARAHEDYRTSRAFIEDLMKRGNGMASLRKVADEKVASANQELEWAEYGSPAERAAADRKLRNAEAVREKIKQMGDYHAKFAAWLKTDQGKAFHASAAGKFLSDYTGKPAASAPPTAENSGKVAELQKLITQNISRLQRGPGKVYVDVKLDGVTYQMVVNPDGSVTTKGAEKAEVN